MKSERRARAAIWIAAVAAGVATAVWAAGAASGGERELAAKLAFAVGGLAACAGVATEVIARKSASRSRALAAACTSTSCFAFAVVCAGAVAAVPLGARLDAKCDAATLAWCERIVERIESFEAEQEQLPLRLEELGDLQRPTWARELRYRPLAGEYTLWFHVSGASDGDSAPLTSGYNSKRDLWWHRDDDPDGRESLFYGTGTIDPW